MKIIKKLMVCVTGLMMVEVRSAIDAQHHTVDAAYPAQ